MWFKLKFFLTVLCGTTYCYYNNFTVSLGHSPLLKIDINEAQGILYVGGKNIFLQLNLDLQEIQRQIIGPVNDSKRCKPFDSACIYGDDFITTDNYISILKLYNSSFLIVCGTAHQGLCFKYNPLDITKNDRFDLRPYPYRANPYMNNIGSSNSSVMHMTKDKRGSDLFYVGQSYDGRNLKYFFKEFAAFRLLPGLSFDQSTHWSFLSVCYSKKHDYKLKFVYIFESGDYIFYVFVRSANVPGSNASYDTRISRLCKDADTFSSYEEIKISCETATTAYNIGLSANFYRRKLYMSFGMFKPNEFRLDDTRGSAICTYTISEINEHLDRDVLTACFVGKLHSPSWQCNLTDCPKIGEQIHFCYQTFMPYGIESNGDGILGKSVFDMPNDIMTSVLPIEYSTEHIAIIAGSITGYLRKIQVLNGTGRLYTTVDVSQNRNIEISSEMVLDKDKNLYVLTGNRVTKLSMTSCRLHQDCGDCVSSQDPLRCGWCFDHCSTLTECSHTVWHNQWCPRSTKSTIRSFFPLKGPVSGNTTVTITGENFDISSSLSVMIGKFPCDIIRRTRTQIFCRTTSCKKCPDKFDSNCQYVGELNLTLDSGILSNNVSFCYMPDPEISDTNKEYRTIYSGGLNLIIFGAYFESVTSHSLKSDFNGVIIKTTCIVQDLGIKLVCPSPDLRTGIYVNVKDYPLTGQMSVLLDDNIFYTTYITVNRDPELYYFDTKDICISQKILELKGEFLNYSLKKEDVIILINHTQCPVLELHDSCLRCDLSTLIHIKDVPLPLTASAGNWRSGLGHIKFVNEYVAINTKIPSIVAGIVTGILMIMILCITVIMAKKHIGCFRKKDDLFPVAFYNTPRGENFLPSNDDMNEYDEAAIESLQLKDNQKDEQQWRELFIKLGKEIITEWKTVGRQLGLSDPQIDTIDMNKLQVEEKAYSVLKNWRDIRGPSATKDILIDCLTKSHLKRVAEIVEKHFSIDDTKVEKQDDEQQWRELFIKIGKEIITDWTHVGRQLGLTDPQINSIDMDKLQVEEKAYSMLQKWRDIKGSSATKDTLIDCLTKSQLKRVAEIVAEHFSIYDTKVEKQDDKDCWSELFHELSNEIGTEWREVGLHLGLTYNQLECIDQNKGQIKEKVFSLLQQWRDLKGRLVSKGDLERALENSGNKRVAKIVEQYPM